MLPTSGVAAAHRLLVQPEFDKALCRLSRALAAAFRSEPRLLDAIGDRGAFAVVAAGLAFQTPSGVTLAAIQDFVVKNQLASARRVRSVAANLVRTGAVWPLRRGQDARARPLAIGGWLSLALERWHDAYVQAAAELSNLAATESAESANRLEAHLKRVVARYPATGVNLASAFEDLSLFLDRKGGHLVLLELLSGALAASAQRYIGSTLSRKRIARDLGVSRAHVTLLLADAEKRGLLHRTGTAVRLRAKIYHRARLWIAHELASALDVTDAENGAPMICVPTQALSPFPASTEPSPARGP